MKTVTLFFLIIAFVALSSCNQNTDTKSLLENTETRNEIISNIAGNHNYMMEFMGAIQENDHAIQMMQGDKNMMDKMMQGDATQMMMKDSTMMRNMMQSMMKDGKVMGNMMQMMHKNEMMSDDCMESCRNMMNEQGLDIIEHGELELSKSNSHGDHH